MPPRSSLSPRSLRGRLALWFGVVVAVVLVGYSVVVYAFAVVEPDHGEPGEAAEAEEAGERLVFALLAALPLALVVGVGGALLITRHGLAPLDEIVDVADRLGVKRLDLRVPFSADAPAEVAQLGLAMNTMLDRLESSVSGLHRFTADAAHELRTPLSRVIGGLETSLRHPRDVQELRAAIGEALEDTQHLARLVEALLTLSRADAGGLSITTGVVDVGAVVQEVVESWRGPAMARGLVLDVDVDTGLCVAGDALWLARVITNLIENACKFTPSGGHVRVAAHAGADDVVVSVDDDGPGIAVEERERVFERFFRSTAVRGSTEGFGLGLPLARDIARALGGDLVVEGRAGKGARLVLRLHLIGARPGGPSSRAAG